MGNWNWPGILLFVAVFLLLTGTLLALIHVDNPLSGEESNIIGWFIDIVKDGLSPSWWPW